MANKSEGISIEDMATFCKSKGFVFQNSEIYGGMSGFFDYGPLGSELKRNIKGSWWKRFISSREDVVGMDGTTITHPKVWQASGHVDNFNDVYVICKECKTPNKLDKNEVGKERCRCGGEYDVKGDLNLMFRTNVGPVADEKSETYLRPETAQLIFANFKSVFDSSRLKLPFGIGQSGRAYRNEISPRDFLFRTREFEQMEIEFFIHPNEKKCNLLKEEDLDFEFQVLTEDNQKNDEGHSSLKLKDIIDKKIAGEWHAYWIKQIYQWFIDNGIKKEKLRLREHMKDELAHYSSACIDIEYMFPFGWKEIHGCADRGQFDLEQHEKASKKSLAVFDEGSKEKVIPRVIEPSQGTDRAFLAYLFDAYEDDKERGNIVLRLNPKLAPFKTGVFPLVNKLKEDSRKIFDSLKDEFESKFDSSGSVGRRYARADEMGIPYCITFDFDSLEDDSVTVRDRDSTKQIRVKISDLKDVLRKLMDSEIGFEEAGKIVEGS